MPTYPIHIHHLFISPGHNYFGHPPGAPGAHPTHAVDAVQAVAGKGLVGDRFFDVRAGFDGQATFFNWEVYRALADALGGDVPGVAACRRNVILSGVPLNGLIGHTFEIDFGDGDTVAFLGTKHCAPCRWMDHGFGPGGHAFLKGRGGLRTQIRGGGVLRIGDAILRTDAVLDLATKTNRLTLPQLP
ncbi:MAG: hypothetical protein KBG20_04905 [Caldilineaceae bacterium]|nr:hypothetical protein [Caldilineaceae bacterium]MBP8107310.1 hypothetical protein [Caldilineaceae bacterium]MBP8121687.1 hypothetical protein [Caldilineaceae bacterium]MBP9071613.1 hypothetical protein [Caldilineaceae bacterium]